MKVTTGIVPEEPIRALVTGDLGRGELKGLLLGSVGLGVAATAR